MKKFCLSLIVFLFTASLQAETVLKQSQTASPLVFLLVSSSDHISGVTGATVTVTLSKNGGSFAAPSGAVTEIANGWYKVAGNATDEGTLGPLLLHATATGADPVDREFLVVAYDPQDSQRIGLGALPSSSTLAVNPTLASSQSFNNSGQTTSLPVETVLDRNSSAGGNTTTTLNLASGTASPYPNAYTGCIVVCKNQARRITGYTGASTYTCSVYPAWQTTPNTDSYVIIANGSADLKSINGFAASQDASNLLNVDVSRINNTAAATPGASGGLLIAGSNAATTFATLTSTGAFTINGTSNVAQTGDAYALVNGGVNATKIGSVNIPAGFVVALNTMATLPNMQSLAIDASGRVTANVAQWNGATVTGMPLPTTSYTSPPTAATIATTVWQDLTTGADFTTANSIGKLFTTNIDAAISSRSTFSGGAVASVTGNVGGNVTGSVGSVLGNVGGNVVGSVASVTGGVTLSATGWNGAALPTSFAASNLPAAYPIDFTTALPGTPTAGTVGASLKFADSRLDAAISTRLAASSYTAPDNATIGTINTGVTAIKAKTDNLPADPSSEANATANKNAIITHGDANWTGGGGGGGTPTGPDAVSVSTLVSAAPLGTVGVHFSQGGINYNFTTGASGVSSGGLTNGTYTVTAAKDGFQLASVAPTGAAIWNGSTLTITGDCTVAITMTPVSIAQPADPGDCNVQLKIFNQDGTVAANKTFFMAMKSAPTGSGAAYLTTNAPARRITTDASGIVTVPLPRLSSWSFGRNTISVPDASTYSPPNMTF